MKSPKKDSETETKICSRQHLMIGMGHQGGLWGEKPKSPTTENGWITHTIFTCFIPCYCSYYLMIWETAHNILLSKKKSSKCKEQINTTFSSINKWKNKTLDFCVSICVFIYVHMQIYAKRKVWKSMPVDKHFFL